MLLPLDAHPLQREHHPAELQDIGETLKVHPIGSNDRSFEHDLGPEDEGDPPRESMVSH